jgi:hypothetical protein
MSLQQLITELFWNPATVGALPGFVLSLTASALLGALVGLVYVRFGQALSNRAQFARNFLLVTVTTTLIITIVKSSLALSLGLVGALSIVRFRAAIKEPEELAYLFLAISIGLGLGAGQALLTLVALAVIIGIIALRGLARGTPDPPNLYLTVTGPASADLGATRLLEMLKAGGAAAGLKRFDRTPDAIEAAFLVDFKAVADLEEFSRQVRHLSPAARISCVDDRGLAV